MSHRGHDIREREKERKKERKKERERLCLCVLCSVRMVCANVKCQWHLQPIGHEATTTHCNIALGSHTTGKEDLHTRYERERERERERESVCVCVKISTPQHTTNTHVASHNQELQNSSPLLHSIDLHSTLKDRLPPKRAAIISRR